MGSIIRHTPHAQAPALPDLRNLGTTLRILLAVNGAAAVVALAQAETLPGFVDQLVRSTAYIEPHLLAQLVVLYVAWPVLARQPYRIGVAVVHAVTVAIALAVHGALRAMLPGDPDSLLKHLLLALVATAVLVAYFRLRQRALSPAIAEARLQALQARIRPHFLFNSLNGVLSLVRRDPHRAEEALHDMADLFRVLMRDNRDLTPLADEVELCRQYLALEQLRLGARLVVDWNVKSMPGDALVPPLVLQPLLENAVYHGIEPSSQPGTVSVNIFLSKGEVHAVLRNPYRSSGGSHHKGNKMALDNVRERLALHFDAEASLESKVLDRAYEVHIRMPYRIESPARPAPDGTRQAAARPRRPDGALRTGAAHG
ncbi:two-component system, LytTR family, sensor histidine kinase AlgZ [Burkholderiales bacterium]|nr:two-component system, LytTR family, sensor histidine kinase AlgZ [Burkholderiales bacterium]